MLMSLENNRENFCNTKKAFGETQTLCAGRSNEEPKIFALPQTPFPGVQDRQNLISWRWSPPAPTDPVWWRSMHAISSYCGNRHRPPQTRPQTGLITIHCAAKLSAQCKNNYIMSEKLQPLSEYVIAAPVMCW